MLTRKITVLSAALAVLATGAVAGCGNTTSSSQTSNASSSNATSTQPVTITLWHMEDVPNREKQFDQVISEFNKSHPSIKVVAQPQDWSNAYQKATAAIQAGSPPDLLFAIPDFATTIVATGAAQPVDSIFSELDAQHHFVKSSVVPYQYNGHTWAVPIFGMQQVLWYRKDIFAANHLQPPTTWDQLLADAKALTKNGNYGIALPASKSLATDQVAYSFMVTDGDQNFVSANGQVTFDNPKTVDAFTLYKELMQYSPPDSNSYTWGEPQTALQNGKAAMAIEKGQYIGSVPSSDLGVVPVPTQTAGQDQGSIYYSNAIMMLAKDPAKQAAIKTFLDWLYQPDNYGNWLIAQPGLYEPVTQDGTTASTYVNNPVIKQYSSQMKTLQDQSSYGYLYGFNNGVNTNIGKVSSQNLIAQALQKELYGGASPEQAVQWGQQQMQQALQ